MKFIELHNYEDNRPIPIDIDQIVSFHPDEEGFAFIEGSGDLLYCGNCHGDLAPAYVEHIHTCPHCGVNLKDKNEY